MRVEEARKVGNGNTLTENELNKIIYYQILYTCKMHAEEK